jgi:hypothetical protein
MSGIPSSMKKAMNWASVMAAPTTATLCRPTSTNNTIDLSGFTQSSTVNLNPNTGADYVMSVPADITGLSVCDFTT